MKSFESVTLEEVPEFQIRRPLFNAIVQYIFRATGVSTTKRVEVVKRTFDKEASDMVMSGLLLPGFALHLHHPVAVQLFA